jgi:fibronectin type 3 domain-containing protein
MLKTIGFRYNWTGLPHEEPAIVALENDDGTSIYVSWNGDTETKTWRFYAVTGKYGAKSFLGEVKRTSFETSLSIPKKSLLHVVAEAVDAKGSVLRSTGVVQSEPEVLPANAQGGLVLQNDKQQWMEL